MARKKFSDDAVARSGQTVDKPSCVTNAYEKTPFLNGKNSVSSCSANLLLADATFALVNAEQRGVDWQFNVDDAREN